MARTPESILEYCKHQRRTEPGFDQFLAAKLNTFREGNRDFAERDDDWLLCIIVNAGGTTLGQMILDSWRLKTHDDQPV